MTGGVGVLVTGVTSCNCASCRLVWLRVTLPGGADWMGLVGVGEDATSWMVGSCRMVVGGVCSDAEGVNGEGGRGTVVGICV